ncbi:hypothetical protein VMCG_03088 [Cytospora schulzeri]|uniref:Uncharacterized protein n=1 Tax=Cytospora schulzeri TaxID=448051 RepID=A0A423WXE9_9PEZI|nr:hypothetical protein VMCG_03088 [Valsa malicola]
MNRFKTKKKAKEDLAAATRPSLESESTFSLFRRGKKSQEQEEKKEIDLTSALPSSDDFRTSLLMSGLSARFSMLREQDDPNTKIGKASDDSVLSPNRQSRLADFGFGNGAGLGDIAEVESIKAPPGPSNDSIASNDSGGVMARSKPTEGNVLFGGRQKIYKIAVGATSSKNLADGMSGRALYDDDVAMSAFQRWRLTEKEKSQPSMDDNEQDDDGKATSDETRPTEDTSFTTRSESPLPQGYNINRETSSTTSSAPSGGRDSTAATSIVSQPATLPKDGHSQLTPTASSVSSTSAIERHVTRTRRLYEQGLTQDLQQQQSSVVSRVDTLTRRPGGARTPDLGPNTPSPTAQNFTDRLVGERRTILSKASAPNLRSFSPPTTGSSIGTMDFGTRELNVAETKGASASTPPLSPPISDAGTGEKTILPIQAQDHGKATAMGVFQKPAQPYDDSKYAERQLQLQQSREALTQRLRKESNASFSDSRSRSEASSRPQDLEIKTNSVSTKAEAPVQEEPVGGTALDDPVESPILNEHVNRGNFSPQVTVERPSDQDHPAFRASAIPTPLSFSQNPDEDHTSGAASSNLLTVNPGQPLLGDSPTLGPNGGLSGMVRQHLRSGSDVSSIFGARDNRESMVISNNPWEDRDSKETRAQNIEPNSHSKAELSINHDEESRSGDRKASGSFLESPGSADGEDEFANQLANARRRVREKLTSFVETDSTLSASPPLQVDPVPPMPSRSNPLGILRGKGSRGSLIDRGREAAPKVNKMLGIGAAISTSPVKEDVDDHEQKATVGVKENHGEHDEQADLKEEENAHPGLRAFRQARRELQNRKELENMAMQSTKNSQCASSPASERSEYDLTRTPSREFQPTGPRQPRKMSVDSQGVPQPPPRSQGRVTRDRSGSDDSGDHSRSRSRPPPRSRETSIPREDNKLNAPATRKPTLRSPGLSGTDTRRSPHLPNLKLSQQGNQSVVPGPYLDRTGSGTNLSNNPLSRTVNESMSAGASPLSPRTGVFELPRAGSQSNGNTGSAPPTPTYPPPRRPSISPNPHMGMHSSTLNNSMKRVINKSEISEPTFVMSTSRVPTMSLPQSATDAREARSRSLSRPRSGSNTAADHGLPPPLPPVNPRRKRDGSKTRTIINNLMGRNSGETDDSALSLSIPHLPVSGQPSPFTASPADDGKSAFSISDDEKPTPRKLRKASSDVRMDSHASMAPGSKRISPPQVAIGPPAGRAVITNNVRGTPGNSMPGGMF